MPSGHHAHHRRCLEEVTTPSGPARSASSKDRCSPNIVLADEIQPHPAKTQAALLQAMQEYRVTAGRRDHPLKAPFLVFATQNPIEQEGTYPLPESAARSVHVQVDVGYPTSDEEVEIVKQGTSAYRPR